MLGAPIFWTVCVAASVRLLLMNKPGYALRPKAGRLAVEIFPFSRPFTGGCQLANLVVRARINYN